MNIVISLDGVICGPTGDLVQKGLLIYRAFKSLGRVILVTDMDRVRAEGWLMLNNIYDYDELIDCSVEVDPFQDLRQRQLRVALSKGPISVFVEADPERASVGLREGISTLMFAQSEYSHFAFRPDSPKTARPWDELVAERTRQQALKATDKRTRPAEMGLWD